MENLHASPMGVLRSILIGLLVGVVQGVTEWLPISSSGHLVAVQVAIGYEPPIFFDGLLHIASAAVVWLTFHRDIRRYLLGFLRGFTRIKGSGFKKAFETQDARMGWYALLALVPAFLFGFFLYDPLEGLFSSLTAVGIAALCTSAILAGSYFFRNGTRKDMTAPRALMIGTAQALAIIPGISRSGATMASGMTSGLDRESAAKFSFLLAIPSLLGATCFVLLKSLDELHLDPVTTVVGVVTVFVVGSLTIRFLLMVVKRWGIHMFACYTFLFGVSFTVIGLYYGL